MRSVEIHDLMASEYPAIYQVCVKIATSMTSYTLNIHVQEFQKVTGERLKALMVEQAKEMEAVRLFFLIFLLAFFSPFKVDDGVITE